MSLAQRFHDWRHEREIQRLADRCAEAFEARDVAKAKHFWKAMLVAIWARSPEQVARMERVMQERCSALGGR